MSDEIGSLLKQATEEAAAKPKEVPAVDQTCEHLKSWLLTEAKRGKSATMYQIGDDVLRKAVVKQVSTWVGCNIKVVKDTLHITWG